MSGDSSLEAVLQNLHIAWEEARAHWRDAKCAEFEERYLKPLPGQTAKAATTLSEIDKLLRKARADCE